MTSFAPGVTEQTNGYISKLPDNIPRGHEPLPFPDTLASDIVENLENVLEQFVGIYGELALQTKQKR